MRTTLHADDSEYPVVVPCEGPPRPRGLQKFLTMAPVWTVHTQHSSEIVQRLLTNDECLVNRLLDIRRLERWKNHSALILVVADKQHGYEKGIIKVAVYVWGASFGCVKPQISWSITASSRTKKLYRPSVKQWAMVTVLRGLTSLQAQDTDIWASSSWDPARILRRLASLRF